MGEPTLSDARVSCVLLSASAMLLSEGSVLFRFRSFMLHVG